MDRIINNILITILLLIYAAVMYVIADCVGFSDKGSVAGYILASLMMFVPFGAEIYSIRRKEEYRNRHKK